MRLSKKCSCKKPYEVEIDMTAGAKGKRDFKKAEKQLFTLLENCECKKSLVKLN